MGRKITGKDRLEIQRQVDDRTPFYMHYRVSSCLTTGCSSVEQLVLLLRRKIGKEGVQEEIGNELGMML